MYEIPEAQLPPGFVDSVGDVPARPATPRPAATTVLLRNGEQGLELLLMRRHRSSGFVPGAWVFPGGRVDPADSGPALHERVRGLGPSPVPAGSYWAAALRELFEETGVLLARTRQGDWVPDATSSRTVERARRALMDHTATLMDVLDSVDATLDVEHTVHAAHWITPVVEPRRYDTHFFLAALPDGRTAAHDPREMTEAAWLAPADALARFEQGRLPMVFPTVKTLQLLHDYGSVDHALEAFRHLDVPPVLPRLVRTPGGVGIVVDD
jgi:8-oxo-dGTP pyrophosphatase MutT (NUDIX family)